MKPLPLLFLAFVVGSLLGLAVEEAEPVMWIDYAPGGGL